MFRSPGFTIVELSITLVILVIMSVIAIPLYHQFMASVELKNTSRVLTIHIQKAKSDAIIHHKNIVLCPSSDQVICNIDWNKHLISFVDSNRNLQHDLNEELLTSIDLNHTYGSMTLQRFGKKQNSIVFQGSSGLPIESNGSFMYCSYDQLKNFKLVLSKMGHVRVEELKNC
ncbi:MULTISPECIES: GspH/FimT family pseudopilin [Acinetobacter]|uniref:GspH/FimT family pseudopilin n=1 Tax=Acinetobacter TaxID=469 RepID=UPI0004F57CFD|nr:MULTISPECIES: GspH/FimT family pseudopilin [Acinetobacter]SSS14526.1 Tfp pilus assembly protein FimT [Acinetobacter baumannii]MBJ8462892.1 GspH/FimT family pseudopilin [Acinetobacter nosocomialis]MBP1486496.1 GspH/FimT family pseudopilin [Acinetobacter nosocomialis]MBP1496782.1 GspH/FimT family pseudopilin [Acinetobacter nosocomialis]MBR7688713.1 GspH/FimT family pseudopilin [Acinetobacter nosocomialis]